jgi:Lipocalin-like domain
MPGRQHDDDRSHSRGGVDTPIREGDLAGRWRLLSYTTGADYPMGRDAAGVLQYSADGKVSVHIMGDGYFAYYGDYTFDEAACAVTHHLEMCSDPELVGVSNVRHARLEGTRLTLTGSMRFGDETREIIVVWEREGG